MFGLLTFLLSNLKINDMRDDDRIYRLVGERVRARRKKIPLTQEQLAKIVGLSRTSMTNIEKGRQRLQVHTLYMLSDALRTEPADLLPQKAELESSTLPQSVRAHLSKLSPEEREFTEMILGDGKERA